MDLSSILMGGGFGLMVVTAAEMIVDHSRWTIRQREAAREAPPLSVVPPMSPGYRWPPSARP